MTVQTALFLLVSGLTNGAIYALLGLGLVLIYNVTRVINIAQGEFVMLGALTAAGLTGGAAIGGIDLAIVAAIIWALMEVYRRRAWIWAPVAPIVGAVLWWAIHALAPFHLPPLAAAIIATAVVAFLGAAIYRIAIQPAARVSELIFLIITTGLLLAIEGLALLFWGPGSFSFPTVKSGEFALGAARVSYQSVFVFGAAMLLLFLIWLFLERSLLGKALRACAMNRRGARLVGISPERAGLMAFAISAALSALAGVLIAPITYATYDMGLFLGLKGFVGAVIGGLSGYGGAVLGGLAVGVLEAYAFYGLSAYGEAIVFALIIVILLFRAITRRSERVA
ncbi:MAG: branched-chain amino acid ABC transporter permease [Burkholderiaceae bacterium]|jgi:branched-chain amino acid transport system permease protein|nr:MAG: branched-chain amino acid ABC transporter permease [Burkholderiaceae bacterium]